MIRTSLLLFLAASLPQSCFAAVTFDWAYVGNAGNASDPVSRIGAVPYDYAISKYEVTNSQYVEFLNAVAASDPHELYSTLMRTTSRGGIVRQGVSGAYTYAVKPPARRDVEGIDYDYSSKPVSYVTFFDAMRFVNWLHNGQGNGNTESGVYSISDGLSETRSADARFWIPSNREWYKAAYHDPSAGTAGKYFEFPTNGNTVPDNNPPSNDSGNSANYNNARRVGNFDVDDYATGHPAYPMTDVGAYVQSASPYGTFDQGGNVWEITDTRVGYEGRGMLGGSFEYGATFLQTSNMIILYLHAPFGEVRSDLGFRVAGPAKLAVPEPTALAIAAMLAGWGIAGRCRVA